MIQWSEYLVSIHELRDYSKNPRRISKSSFDKLVKSLREDGYHQRLLVNLDNTIIGGHQRKRALLEAGFRLDDKILVLKPDVLLNESELQRLNIRDNLEYGEFDFDILANEFNIEDLVNWGMEGELFPSLGEQADDILKDASSEDAEKCDKCGKVLS
jgi:ParB-like chromosome segregation protein Spo0J